MSFSYCFKYVLAYLVLLSTFLLMVVVNLIEREIRLLFGSVKLIKMLAFLASLTLYCLLAELIVFCFFRIVKTIYLFVDFGM